MSDKLTCLHSLCEWQLEITERLRAKNDSEEEAVTWRVMPVGWDREGNTYWLFDDNRLWIQRVPIKAIKKSKPKRTYPTKNASTRKKARRMPQPRPAGRRSSRLSSTKKDSVGNQDLFDSDSELSPPPDDDDDDDDVGETKNIARSWFEFETICITRHEWQAFVDRFAKSKHPDERNMHNYISKEILPPILEVIHAEEKRLAIEAALSNRKRSSRIALRDSEREQREREEAELRDQKARAAAAIQAERERTMREVAERQTQKSREDRLRERGERLLARERMMQERMAQEEANKTVDEWRLRCEICKMDEMSPAESRPVVACEKCSNWQHATCWDEEDRQRNAQPRNWEDTTFVCRRCDLSLTPNEASTLSAPSKMHDQPLLSGQDSAPPERPALLHHGSAPAITVSPLHSSAASVPSQRIKSPTLKPLLSPRGSFPLRTHHMRSPLSRPVEPDSNPPSISLDTPERESPFS